MDDDTKVDLMKVFRYCTSNSELAGMDGLNTALYKVYIKYTSI